MSRQLPARPNLEHLRKQAKELLEQLQRTNSSAQLADAQHAVAADYGFASWPKLKAHVVEFVERADDKSRQPNAGTVNPLGGRWTADSTRSTPHPANPWRAATIVFEVDGDTVRVADTVVDAAGREEHHVNTIHTDGIEHGSGTGNGYSLIARWRDQRTLETVGKKDGQVVGSATYQVSADGNTLTISSHEQFVVLNRSREAAV